MKKILISLCSITVVTISSDAQTLQHFTGSPIEIPSQNDTFRVSFTNDHNYTITVFPMWNRFGCETILRDEESLKDYYLSRMSGISPLEQQLSIINAVATIMKSPLYKNRNVPFNAWGNQALRSKKFSYIGSKLSFYDWNCGDSAEEGAHDLFLTGLFPNWYKFRNFSIQGVHSVFERYWDGSWMLIDYDNGMPGFMQRNPVNPSGFASAEELFQNPTLIVDSARYFWQNPNNDELTDLAPFSNMERYRAQVFQSQNNTSYGYFGEAIPRDVSGEWKIPPGVGISWTYPVCEKLVDSTGYSQQIVGWWLTGQIDSIINSIALGLNISYSEAEALLQNGTIASYDGEHFYPYMNNVLRSMPYLEIKVPARQSPINLGQDLCFPFVVRKVVSDGEIILGDTVLGAGVTQFYLYDTIPPHPDSGPIVTNNMVNYLDDGIIPAGTNVTFTVYFNPHYYQWWEGMNIEVSGDDTLTIFSQYTSADGGIITGKNDEGDKDGELWIFPNPAKAGSRMPQLIGAEVLSIDGRLLPSSENAPIIPGVYIINKSGLRPQKLMVVK